MLLALMYSSEEIMGLSFQATRMEMVRLDVVPAYSIPGRYAEQLALRLVESADTDSQLALAIDVSRSWLVPRATPPAAAQF